MEKGAWWDLWDGSVVDPYAPRWHFLDVFFDHNVSIGDEIWLHMFCYTCSHHLDPQIPCIIYCVCTVSPGWGGGGGGVLPIWWVIHMCRGFDPLFLPSGYQTRSFWGVFSHPPTQRRSFGYKSSQNSIFLAPKHHFPPRSFWVQFSVAHGTPPAIFGPSTKICLRGVRNWVYLIFFNISFYRYYLKRSEKMSWKGHGKVIEFHSWISAWTMMMASQITSVLIGYSTICSSADHRKLHVTGL